MSIRRTPEEVKPLLTGVINIQFTPFKSETEIDEDALRAHTAYMIEGGIQEGVGVQVIGGSNGEGFSLSENEYHHLIDTVVEVADGRVPIVVGCTRPATVPVIALAKYAEQAGADAIMVLAPHYYPNPSHDLVVKHFRAIAEATNIGIMVYNNPGVTGLDMPIPLIERLAEIQNIVAFKETTSNMFKLRQVAYHFKDRFSINANTYRWMMPLDYQLGIKGFNNYFGNIDPVFAIEMHRIGESGDFDSCHELWTRMIDLYNYSFAGDMYKATAYGKEMVRIAGISMGDHTRIPLLRPGKEEREHLKRLMQKAGIGGQ
jgi:4-hydroxy-tetrahydrodipicolinate synthase